MCGFIGINAPSGDIVGEIYEALIAVQHRGQDAAGITTYNGNFNVKKGLGLVREVFNPKNVARLRGNLGVGHVRYPTVGGGASQDVQPFHVTFPYGIAMAHNGNVTNFLDLKNKYFAERGLQLASSCDLEAILYVFAQELTKGGTGPLTTDRIFDAVRGVFETVKGSYSVVGVVDGGMLAFRDPFGIKPIVLGERVEKDGQKSYAIASESVVLDVIGYKRVRDIQNGEAIYIDRDRNVHSQQLVDKSHRPCIFEIVYFARPDSILDGISVYQTRRRFGEKLAEKWKRENGPEIDAVIPVPDTAREAANAMALALGVPYREGLVKNRYIGRTFIMPSQEARTNSIRRKVNPIAAEFEGKRVLLVDDSIVRGNTSKKLVEIAREAGAAKVYFASCSPPLLSPCPYGIDMSTKNEFIARDREIDDIRKAIVADYLIYLDLADMNEAARVDNPKIDKFCNGCFTGEYPTGDVTTQMLNAIENERLDAQNKAGAKKPRRSKFSTSFLI